MKPLTPSEKQEIETALHQGRKIEAIKLYRQYSGLGLKESKDIIDHWSSPLPSLSDSQLKTIQDSLFHGKKLEAIQLYREYTQTSLAEAKNVVEAIDLRLKQEYPDDAFPQKRGCLSLILFFVLSFSWLSF
jgi:ribosomal protein L7/L12